jgi:hypothetical protein
VRRGVVGLLEVGVLASHLETARFAP